MSYNLESNAPPSKIIFMNSKDATTYTMFDKTTRCIQRLD